MYMTFWKLVQFNSSLPRISWVRSWSQEQSTHNHLSAGMGLPELRVPSSIPTLTPAIPTTFPLTTQGGVISFLSHSFTWRFWFPLLQCLFLCIVLSPPFIFSVSTWNSCAEFLPKWSLTSAICHYRPFHSQKPEHTLESKHIMFDSIFPVLNPEWLYI